MHPSCFDRPPRAPPSPFHRPTVGTKSRPGRQSMCFGGRSAFVARDPCCPPGHPAPVMIAVGPRKTRWESHQARAIQYGSCGCPAWRRVLEGQRPWASCVSTVGIHLQHQRHPLHWKRPGQTRWVANCTDVAVVVTPFLQKEAVAVVAVAVAVAPREGERWGPEQNFVTELQRARSSGRVLAELQAWSW